MRDSAGVEIVTITELDPASLPLRNTRRLFRLEGDVGDGAVLFGVQNVTFIEGGGFVIANAGTTELFFMSSEGKLIRRVGRMGEGPGEFRSVGGVWRGSSGEVVTHDPLLHRLTQFSTDGALLGTIPLVPPREPLSVEPIGWLESGQILGRVGIGSGFFAGEYRDTVPLLLYDPNGAVVETLGVWLGRERFFHITAESGSQVAVGFGRDVLHAFHSGRLAVGSTDQLVIDVFEDAGRHAQRLVIETDPRAVNRADADALLATRLDALSGRFRARREAAIRAAPVRETYPAFGGLAVGPDGSIWVGEYPSPQATTQTWTVLDPPGRPRSRVELPATGSIVDLSDGRILVRGRDALGVEYIEVYAIES